MTEGTNSVAKTYDLLKWMLPVISKFPKERKYTLGQRIENKLIEVLELLIRANYTRQKIDILRDANIGLEILRYLARMSCDLRFISIEKYEYINRELNQIGRMIGGWIRQQSVK